MSSFLYSLFCGCFGFGDKTKQQGADGEVDWEAVSAARTKVNALYQEKQSLSKASQAAYQANDKQEAHTLSVKSKALAKTISDVEAKCVMLIVGVQRQRICEGTIDLHGLHVVEAEIEVVKFLDLHSKRQRQQQLPSLSIITGRGNHSANHHAVVKPAVEKILMSRRLVYSETHLGGCYLVHIDDRARQ